MKTKKTKKQPNLSSEAAFIRARELRQQGKNVALCRYWDENKEDWFIFIDIDQGNSLPDKVLYRAYLSDLIVKKRKPLKGVMKKLRRSVR